MDAHVFTGLLTTKGQLMELILTPEIENAIKRQADERGISPEQLALEELQRLFVPSDETPGEEAESLAEFLDGYIGVLHSGELVEGGAAMSDQTGAQFTRLLMQKREQDRL